MKNADIEGMLIIEDMLILDLSVLDNMPKDELINLIKSMDNSTPLKIIQKMNSN
ncbi:hypothetical protein [Shimazuella alba]|uniref:Uncharacterized protein n=1 Tax=Shimazuella alba TaxID=2690964 RepID=A0A6I4VPW1_9BACL|nr:hypothetical protein [Shimazuella alba]MXQ52315.1 hypothetical protein [Shimazuella alba]